MLSVLNTLSMGGRRQPQIKWRGTGSFFGAQEKFIFICRQSQQCSRLEHFCIIWIWNFFHFASLSQVVDQVPQDFDCLPPLLVELSLGRHFPHFTEKTTKQVFCLENEWIKGLKSSLTTSRGTTQLSMCRLQIEEELNSTLEVSLAGLIWDPLRELDLYQAHQWI